MDNYNLAQNEVVLFKCDAALGEKVVLTNINLVLIDLNAGEGEEQAARVYSMDEVKVYNEIPQIKQTDCSVEIFFANTEVTVEFCSKGDARKFVGAALELVTGKSSTERGAAKVKSAIGLIDDTLGIDSVGAVKSAISGGLTKNVLGIFGKKNGNAKKPAENSADNASGDAVEMLKKLKELLDMGIITQEEFDAKKQKILRGM